MRAVRPHAHLGTAVLQVVLLRSDPHQTCQKKEGGSEARPHPCHHVEISTRNAVLTPGETPGPQERARARKRKRKVNDTRKETLSPQQSYQGRMSPLPGRKLPASHKADWYFHTFVWALCQTLQHVLACTHHSSHHMMMMMMTITFYRTVMLTCHHQSSHHDDDDDDDDCTSTLPSLAQWPTQRQATHQTST